MKSHNNRETTIITKIKNNPGIRYRELSKITKIPNSTIGYYIKKLERNQNIVTSRIDNSCRFFMPEFNESQCRIITMLRGKNTRKIMIALENDMLTFSLLVEQLKINPSTISINLKKLISFRIVEKNKKNKFTLKTKDITKMINKYKSMTAIFGTVLFYNILQNQNNFMLINLSGFV